MPLNKAMIINISTKYFLFKFTFFHCNKIKIGKEKNFRTLVSRIAGKSEASVHLHKKLGFSNIGTMKKVGKKFGEIIDVHLMQILF